MSKITRSSYAVLVACTFSHFIHHIFSGVLSPFLPLIEEELSLSYTEVGMVASAAVITLTISHLIVGYFVDKGMGKSFISLTIILSSIILLFTSSATTFLFLVICMLLLGVMASGFHPAAFPEISKWFPKSKRSLSIGIQETGGLIAMAIIPLLGIILVEMLGGWRDAFVALGILGIFIFILVFFLMRFSKGEAHQYEDNQTSNVGVDGWTRNYAISLVIVGLRGMTFRSITLLMPFYLVETYGLAPLWAGSLTTIMLTAGLFGEIISMYYSDKMRRRLPFMIMSMVFLTPCLFLLTFALAEIWLILVLIIIGFGFFFAVPAFTAWLTEVSPKESQGLAFGLLFSIGATPGALSPFIFGVIGDLYGLQTSILFLVITATLATFLMLFLKEPKSR